MHTVVEIIPLLLHASLFLFFLGLVAFLLPVNIALTIIATIILGIVTVVYILLTVLPLVYHDCPYRTPLSGGFWRLRRRVQTAFNRWYSQQLVSQLHDETMAEEVFRKAIEPSSRRSTRDTQALVWTVKSLADDNELEPFIGAIPDVLWVSDLITRAVHAGDITNVFIAADLITGAVDKRRFIYDEQIRRLMVDPKVQLLRRMEAFEDSCFSGLLNEEVRIRRQICIYKAIWALGCLSAPGQPAFPPLVSDRTVGHQITREVLLYTTSATTMQRWANMRAAQPLLDETLRHLTKYQTEISNAASKIPDITVLAICNSKLAKYCFDYPSNYPPLNEVRKNLHTQALLSKIEDGIDYIHTLPFIIFIDYLSDAATSETPPYQFATTRLLISPTSPIPSSVQFRMRVVRALNRVMEAHRDLFQTCEHPHWLDEVFRLMFASWEPPDSGGLPWGVLDYVNCRKSRGLVSRLESALSERAWTAVSRSIGAEHHPASRSGLDPPGFDLEKSLTAVWRICRAHKLRRSGTYPSAFADLIKSVCNASIPLLTPSVLAMAKLCFFRALNTLARSTMDGWEIEAIFNDRHFPSETSISIPGPEEAQGKDLDQLSWLVGCRCTEAGLDALSEFVECCVSGELPFEAADTIDHIAPARIESTIHRAHQVRFACAVSALFNAAVDSPDQDGLLKTILRLRLFSVYVENDASSDLYAWLDDYDARHSVKTTLTAYLARLSSADTEDSLLDTMETIIDNMQEAASSKVGAKHFL
ncbi:hypothetical protein DFH06DRAFT_1342551 [Mycena polygramma]|nr:hypothetical protein DFH06DRAFT_1342551 [Mycena polygramma]